MRVTFVIDTLASGGAQRQLVELAAGLQRRHLASTSVVSYRAGDFFAARLREAGVVHRRVRRAAGMDPGFPRRLARTIAADHPDLVHAFLLTPGLWTRLATALLSHPPVMLAAERNSRVASTRREGLLQRLLYRSARATTVNADPVRDTLHARLGIPLEKLHYIPNGIDLEAWDQAGREPSGLEPSPGRFRLALIGGLRPQKNHGLLLDALERLAPATTECWEVWLVGDATAGEASAEQVRARVARSPLAGRIHLHGAVANVAGLLRSIDLLVLPSRSEGFPNVVLEAMASGVPVVATRVGDVANLVTDGESGLLVPSGDVAALASALESIWRMDDSSRGEMGRKGRQRVEERFTLEAVAARYLELYRAVLEETR